MCVCVRACVRACACVCAVCVCAVCVCVLCVCVSAVRSVLSWVRVVQRPSAPRRDRATHSAPRAAARRAPAAPGPRLECSGSLDRKRAGTETSGCRASSSPSPRSAFLRLADMPENNLQTRNRITVYELVGIRTEVRNCEISNPHNGAQAWLDWRGQDRRRKLHPTAPERHSRAPRRTPTKYRRSRACRTQHIRTCPVDHTAERAGLQCGSRCVAMLRRVCGGG